MKEKENGVRLNVACLVCLDGHRESHTRWLVLIILINVPTYLFR